MNFIKKHKGFLFLLIFLFFWALSLIFISPQEIVSFIGIETGYIFIFLTALIGVSGFASAPFYATLVTFLSTGEFNILILLLIVSPARAFGDSLFFLLGYKGHSLIRGFMSSYLNSFSNWLSKKPEWMIPIFAYLYSSFTFFPQDILMIVLGVGRVKFYKIFIAVLLGNATFILLINFLIIPIFPDILIGE